MCHTCKTSLHSFINYIKIHLYTFTLTHLFIDTYATSSHGNKYCTFQCNAISKIFKNTIVWSMPKEKKKNHWLHKLLSITSHFRLLFPKHNHQKTVREMFHSDDHQINPCLKDDKLAVCYLFRNIRKLICFGHRINQYCRIVIPNF